MNKIELISNLAEENGLTKSATRSIVDGLVDTILKTLKKDKRFALSGLGVFHVVKRAKRTCRNPQTGEPVVVKARNVIKFKPSRTVKNSFY
ncbi:MAG: HU family DNA-binding protein [Deltaproteobacteria bacterium]|jgi:DNA-binding protein HU-beta|nr:HU family DNA-binding protein [Deltaproteobacteria bacterium]